MRFTLALVLSVVIAGPLIAAPASDELRAAWEICKPHLNITLNHRLATAGPRKTAFAAEWAECEAVLAAWEQSDDAKPEVARAQKEQADKAALQGLLPKLAH